MLMPGRPKKTIEAIKAAGEHLAAMRKLGEYIDTIETYIEQWDMRIEAVREEEAVARLIRKFERQEKPFFKQYTKSLTGETWILSIIPEGFLFKENQIENEEQENIKKGMSSM